jgi:hypothetical protein
MFINLPNNNFITLKEGTTKTYLIVYINKFRQQ